MEREKLTYACGRRSIAILLRGACIIILTSRLSLKSPLREGTGGAFGCWKEKERLEMDSREQIWQEKHLYSHSFAFVNSKSRSSGRRDRFGTWGNRKRSRFVTLDKKGLQMFEDRRIDKERIIFLVEVLESTFDPAQELDVIRIPKNHRISLKTI